MPRNFVYEHILEARSLNGAINRYKKGNYRYGDNSLITTTIS
ncbi:hypothetical protein PT276_09090 [Orbaceae bacterium ESL0721]|nr:hypothetical protein [Orbaceae bacterium ESL0721]